MAASMLKGPKGRALVYKGTGHDWVLEFWPSRGRKRKAIWRVFPRNKSAAVIVAKQLVGAW